MLQRPPPDPFWSSIINHLALIPAISIYISATIDRWFIQVAIGTMIVQAAGMAAYLPVAWARLAPMACVIAGNLVLCLIVGGVSRRRGVRRTSQP